MADAVVMTRPGAPRRWDPFHPLDMLTSLWSAAAVAPVSNGAAVAYRTVFMTLRRLVVGRRLAVRLDAGDLTLSVTEFDSRLDLRNLAVGQLNDVRIAACDLQWNSHRFDRATAVLHNVHLRPSAPPVLVAAPVELTIDIPSSVLDDLVRWATPHLTGDVDQDGIARLRLARRPGFGHLVVEADIDGSTLWIRPRSLAMRRSRWKLPTRTPAYPVRLPDLPRGLILTGIRFEPGLVGITGTVPEWQLAVPRKRLDDILNQLGAAGAPLNLTRLGRLW
jgi:hypothetical protein